MLKPRLARQRLKSTSHASDLDRGARSVYCVGLLVTFNIYPVLVIFHLLALFLLVGLGFYVFVADPRKRANQTFAAFIAFLAIWTTKDLIFWNFYLRDATAAWWASASFIIALLMQYALAVFAWVFPENSRTPRRKAAILFSPGLVFVPAALFGLLTQKAGFVGDRLVVELTPLAFAFALYVYIVFFYGAVVLIRKYRKYRGTVAGSQVGAIVWGLAITGLLKSVANIILPYFGVYDLLPFSSLFALPGVLIYAYAILNFELFSLQTALKQFRLFPVTYKVALSIASVAVISFVAFQIPITWWAFKNGMDQEAWRRYLTFSLISALIPNLLLLLMILRTISRPLQRITSAAVQIAKGSYGTTVDMRSSNDEIGLLAISVNEMSRKMASDIAEMQRLNEQLMRAEKLAAMGTLAAGVAHEVNNPLASISSLVQMMRSEEGHSTETREKLSLIAKQIERITSVTREMTNFARSRAPVRSDADINTIVKSSLRLARFDPSFQFLDIETDLADGLSPVLADEDQLQQVILNLLINARDAMPQGGEMLIRTRSEGGRVSIEITDTGTGIDQSELSKIFDPFYTTKTPGRGTGLGLAVCYSIVSAHGGSIDVESRPAAGTSFRVWLPAAEVKTFETSTD